MLSVETETETGVGDNCDWTVDDCLDRKFHCVPVEVEHLVWFR